MEVSDISIEKKIQELLLNRVAQLNWTYFDLDLNESYSNLKIYAEENEIIEFFRAITRDEFGNYKCHENYDEKTILKVLLSIIKANPRFLRKVLYRLFDINEIKNESDSDEGILGRFNKKDQVARNKKYFQKIKEGHRKLSDNVVILAEGDSWFQFPRVFLRIDPVKDIVDWLIDDEKYAVYSLAEGGDWLANIFYSGDYIEELPKISPDVFLISGGGNDLVGNNRLATMVVNPNLEGLRDIHTDPVLKRLLTLRESDEEINLEKYKKGLSFISEEFINFLNLYFIQYFIFLYSLANVDKYKKMIMITQGYDYALPYDSNRGFWLSVQRITNEFTDTGHWLAQPLNMKGITNKADQEAIVYTMIYEFNEMLIKLANFKGLPRVFHIDCRGYADEEDWFDELHLKSKGFKDIAKVYKYCITQNLFGENNGQKVYKVKKKNKA
jgi:hypothetical protein